MSEHKTFLMFCPKKNYSIVFNEPHFQHIIRWYLMASVLLSSSDCKELYLVEKVSKIMVEKIWVTQTRMWSDMEEKNTDGEKVANGGNT